MQDGENVLLALQNVEGKGVSLFADEAIARDQFVAQYVGEVVSRTEYVTRERRVRISVLVV